MAVNYGRRWYPSTPRPGASCAPAARAVVPIIAISGGPRAMLWHNHTHMMNL
jgi:hypothetical protein